MSDGELHKCKLHKFLLHKCKLYHVSPIYSFFTISSGMELLGQGWGYIGITSCFFFNPFASPGGHITSLAKCLPSTYIGRRLTT